MKIIITITFTIVCCVFLWASYFNYLGKASPSLLVLFGIPLVLSIFGGILIKKTAKKPIKRDETIYYKRPKIRR